MTAARQLTREQILAQPPVISLATLAECLGVSEPVVRRLNASGELAALGIRVNRLGAQWRVVTSTVVAYRDRASTVPTPGDGAGQRGPAAHALRLASGGDG